MLPTSVSDRLSFDSPLIGSLLKLSAHERQCVLRTAPGHDAAESVVNPEEVFTFRCFGGVQ